MPYFYSMILSGSFSENYVTVLNYWMDCYINYGFIDCYPMIPYKSNHL